MGDFMLYLESFPVKNRVLIVPGGAYRRIEKQHRFRHVSAPPCTRPPAAVNQRLMIKNQAKYHLGQIVRHRKHPFRGVIFDVDPEFANTEEWYQSIPEDIRPDKTQPFYHLLAENESSYYVAYVSEQNLEVDYSGEPVDHPDIPDLFGPFENGHYPLHFNLN